MMTLPAFFSLYPMSPEQIEFVLASAYHSGWINVDQYHAAHAGLQSMPGTSAIDFLLEQEMTAPGRAGGLPRALTPPAPGVEPAAVPAEPPAEQAEPAPTP